MRPSILTLLILLSAIPGLSQLYFPPNNSDSWDTMEPDSLGYCQEGIDSLYSYLEANNSKAFILLKDGKIVLEQYFDSFTKDSLWYWASAGKTLTAMLVGLAQQENFLSISDTTSKYLGEGWTSASPEQEEKITIWHQLTMTNGLNDGVPNPDCKIDTCLEYLADAGARWAYHNAPYTLLDHVMEAATGITMNQFHSSRLRNPIGMNGAYINLGDNNVYFSSPRSMARYGLFLLGKGKWNGNTILTDTAYYQQMVKTSQNLNQSYGYLTWLNGKTEFMIPQTQFVFPGSMNQDAPEDMYAALGKNAQLLNVVPSENLVWVRMGDAPPSGTGLITPLFNNEIWVRINDLECALNTNLDDRTLNSKIKFFPVPVSSQLLIQSDQVINRVELFDIWGKQLYDGHYSSKNVEIPFYDLNQGIYVARVYLQNGDLHIERIVKN